MGIQPGERGATGARYPVDLEHLVSGEDPHKLIDLLRLVGLRTVVLDE